MNLFKKDFSLSQRKLYTAFLVVLILGSMFLLALFSSKGAFGISGDSGTVDEVAHIPSGYSYDKYMDYRLNPEHPPLAKALAGFPLAVQSGIKGIKNDWSWNGINQWEAGWYILYEAGNNPASVLFWARLPMILLMIGLGLFLFKWASELWGRKIGLLVLLLYAFYPDVIAHGRLVTTDIAAAFGYVIAIYYFNKALLKNDHKSVVYAGIAFGVAQLLKFSSFLLFGVLLFLVIIKSILDRKETSFGIELWKNFKKYFWTCFISLIVVWIVYIPFAWRTPVGIEHEVIERNLTQDPRTLPLRNFLHLFESNPITRGLGHYILGIMLVFARVAGGNATFALGHISDKSISWYFPFAWLVKTPIAIILLFFWSIVTLFISKFYKNKEKFWIASLFLTPWLVYWAFTLKGSLNIGIRHLMPTVPFVLLLIGYGLNEIWKSKSKIGRYVVGALAMYLIISTLSYYPSYIGYFNEAVPRDQRYKYLVDSSLDWGQDLLRLKKYVDNNNISQIKVDYFGGSVPSYYIPQQIPWHSSYGPTTGWIAVSATFYQSSKLYGEKEGKWSYGWLDRYQPVAEIGGSILVFHITQQDLIKNPPVSPYPITKIDLPGSLDQNNRKVGL
ncbi:MAG: glycosyltransferase family 39 protein [Patescibacteria group bacterium]|nr:glycosyltransferase family 39 protein [Patescibacteria group bacterium]